MAIEKPLEAVFVPRPELVTISAERYEQLIKSETALEILKNSIRSIPSYARDEYLLSILGIKDGDKDGAE